MYRYMHTYNVLPQPQMKMETDLSDCSTSGYNIPLDKQMQMQNHRPNHWVHVYTCSTYIHSAYLGVQVILRVHKVICEYFQTSHLDATACACVCVCVCMYVNAWCNRIITKLKFKVIYTDITEHGISSNGTAIRYVHVPHLLLLRCQTQQRDIYGNTLACVPTENPNSSVTVAPVPISNRPIGKACTARPSARNVQTRYIEQSNCVWLKRLSIDLNTLSWLVV